MKAVTAIGVPVFTGGVDIGSVGMPKTAGRPPKDPVIAGFYPLEVEVERWFKLQRRVRELQLGEAFVAQDVPTGVLAELTPVTFNRQYAQTEDERELMFFPGACNFLTWTTTTGLVTASGEIHLGWNGGTPIDPLTPTVPVRNVWPPVPQTRVYFDAFTIGTGQLDVSELNGGCYVLEETVWPFVWIWIRIGDTVYTTHPGMTPPDGYVVEAAPLAIRIFGWGVLPLYAMRAASTAPALLSVSELKLQPSRYWARADRDGKNPIWDEWTGRKIGFSSLETTRGPVA